MATRDLSYKISFDVDGSDLRSAASDVDALTDALDDVQSDSVEIAVEVPDLSPVTNLQEALDRLAAEKVTATVEVETGRSLADVIELQEELDNFSQEDFIAEMKVDLDQARADVLRFAADLEDLQDFDLPGVREGVQAEFAEASQRVEGLEQDLRDLGVVLDSVDDGSSLEEVGRGAGRAAEGVDKVRRSADQSRSVLANLAGNAAQDLGQLGGVVGSLGVGIGQLAEYAVDGNIALSNLAKVAVPMLGVAGALALVNSAAAENKREAEEAAAAVKAYTDAIDDLGEGAEAAAAGLTELTDAVVQPATAGILQDIIDAAAGAGESVFDFFQAPNNSGDFDVLGVLGDLGYTLDQVSEAMAGGRESWDAFMSTIDNDPRLEGMGADVEKFLNEQFTAYTKAVDTAAGRAAFFVSSLDSISEALESQAAKQSDTDRAWNNLLIDLGDGIITTDLAKNAWNQLRDELNLTDAQMATLAQSKLDDKINSINDAVTELAGGALSDAGDAAIDAAEALDELVESAGKFAGGAIGDIADQLEAIADSAGSFAGGVFGDVADEAIEARDHLLDVAEAAASINDILGETPDLAGALTTALDGVDAVFGRLTFDESFDQRFQDALDGLRGFEPDLQTLVDNWSDILSGVQIDLLGNVRSDDAAALAAVQEVVNVVQEGVVDAYSTGGVDAGQAFLDSLIQQISEATGIAPEQLYQLVGVGPDGTIDALIQPTIDADNAAKAKGILDAIAGTGSTDPRIVEIQVQLLTGEITPEEALAQAQQVYQDWLDENHLTQEVEVEFKTPTDLVNAGLAGAIAGASGPAVSVDVDADTAPFDTAMAALLAASREATVNAILGSYPTTSDVIAAVTGGAGAVRIPIDYFVRSAPRLDGVRTQAV